MNKEFIKSFDDLIISNKDKWMLFYEKCIKDNNLNIGLFGPSNTCKTTISKLIINDFIEKNKKINKNKLIFKYESYSELSLQQKPNILTIFCQNQINCDKIVYIENFDDLNEQSQQEIKILMDQNYFTNKKYKIHFIIETNNEIKMKQYIRSRLNIFYCKHLKNEQLFIILKNICYHFDISVHDNCINYLNENKYINITSLRNFVEKIFLLNKKSLTYNDFCSDYQIFNPSIFESYFNYIKLNNYFKANQLLLDLYDNGYNLSDILYFLYLYVKNNSNYYYVIEIICFYINQYYDGKMNKIFILFLTNDIKKKIDYNI